MLIGSVLVRLIIIYAMLYIDSRRRTGFWRVNYLLNYYCVVVIWGKEFTIGVLDCYKMYSYCICVVMGWFMLPLWLLLDCERVSWNLFLHRSFQLNQWIFIQFFTEPQQNMDIAAITIIPINEHFCSRSCFSKIFSDEGLGESYKSNEDCCSGTMHRKMFLLGLIVNPRIVCDKLLPL